MLHAKIGNIVSVDYSWMFFLTSWDALEHNYFSPLTETNICVHNISTLLTIFIIYKVKTN